MKCKSNIKLLKILGISAITLGTSLPLVSCSYYKSWNNNDLTDKDNNNNSENNYYKGTIDSSITDSKIISSTDSPLVESNPNDYGLLQNSDDFASNGDFSKVIGNQGKLKDDIIGFLNILYFSNNKQISITNSKVEKLNIVNVASREDSSKKQYLKLNSSKISFDLIATISSGDSLTKIKFPWGQEDLAPNSSKVLKISVNNQVILPSINVMNSKYYLGWKVKAANVAFEKNNKEIKDLNFTYNSFSKAFYVSYNNLSNVNSYFDLQKQYGPNLYKNLSEDKFKKLFEENVDKQQENYFFYADMATSLVSLISENKPVDIMVKIASKYLVEILSHMNIIPNEFEDVLIEALYGKTDSDNTIISKPLINVLYDNREKIFSLLKSYLGSAYDVIEPIISEIKPNMTTSDKGYKAIKNYVDMLLDSVKDEKEKQTLSEIIYGDILGIKDKGQPKSLWNIILTRYEFIINFMQSKISGFNQDTAKNILNILKIIFKQSQDNKYSSVIDSIFGSKENRKSLFDIIVPMIPGISDQVKTYLNILIIDNDGLDKVNILALVNSFSSFLNELFEYNEKSTSKAKYSDRYKIYQWQKNGIMFL